MKQTPSHRFAPAMAQLKRLLYCLTFCISDCIIAIQVAVTGVAINDMDKKVMLYEIKMNKEKIKINKLKDKSTKLLKKYHDYEFEYNGLSINDIERLLERTI